MKYKVELTSLDLYPLTLDANIYTKYTLIQAHAEHMGNISLEPKSIGRILITSTSLGGLLTVDFEHKIYNITVDNLDFKKVAQFLGDKKFIKSGRANGTAIYYKKKKKGTTDLKMTEVVLNGMNINKQVSTVNDALNLNMISLMSRELIGESNSTDTTDVDHLQFNIELKNNYVTVKDVALKTDNFRIALKSVVHKKGAINYFHLHLLDKNGCSIIMQKFKGSIKKPKKYDTTTKIERVVKTIPNSFFGMGMQMMSYGQEYTMQQTNFKQKDFYMSSYMLEESDYMFRHTSKMILPNDCEVVYTGVVPHPVTVTKNPLIR
ncbi:hypothetical protein JHD48_01745 [Sulfurimonas sp. SAG-AH-194-I05]|nr:hypothetical protein [Sulfurimonas sp. SAG-AH-194-I05]MDF1874451.1 hypothetical protein [Sulfurimonas sp. SAG-AH-194-I05]